MYDTYSNRGSKTPAQTVCTWCSKYSDVASGLEQSTAHGATNTHGISSLLSDPSLKVQNSGEQSHTAQPRPKVFFCVPLSKRQPYPQVSSRFPVSLFHRYWHRCSFHVLDRPKICHVAENDQEPLIHLSISFDCWDCSLCHSKHGLWFFGIKPYKS